MLDYSLMKSKMNIFYLALLWSPSALCLKVASSDIPPITLVCLSMAIASAALILTCLRNKEELPKINKKLIFQGISLGALCNGIPFTLQALAAPKIDSTHAGIINSLIPIITFIGCCVLTPDKSKFSFKRMYGTFIGVVGLVLLVYSSGFSTNNSSYLQGVLFAVLSSTFYSLGLIYANSLNLSRSLIYPTMHVTSTLLYLPIIAYILEGPINIQPVSITSICALLFLALPSTSLAFVYYYRILKEIDAIALSTVNYILPVLKVCLGFFALGEIINMKFAISSCMIITGMLMTA